MPFCAHAVSAQQLWDLFSRTYTTNVLAWTRHNDNPVIAPSGSTWKGRWTGSPEFLAFEGRTLLYYRGNGILPGKGKAYADRIGVAEILDIGTMKLTYRDLNKGYPVINVGVSGEFDDAGALDPAAAVFKGQVYLYYSALGKGPNSIGLAVSTNGEEFTKVGKVLEGRAPDVLVVRDTLFLIYQKRDPAGYKIYMAFSIDGRRFTPLSPHPVFTGEAGRWDAKSVSSPRLWIHNNVYYMLWWEYGFREWTEFFGLARSKDLRTWEAHPGTLSLERGCTVPRTVVPSGLPRCTKPKPDCHAVRRSRGKYNWDQLSSICMAWIAKR
jgi:predicted GH43/DUF377 family glycosyl hydrolase